MTEKYSSIKNSLKILGLSEFDQQVYLLILKAGIANVSFLARDLSVERPTVYNSLQRLQNYGLMAKQSQNYSRKISVEPPSMILALMEKQKSSINNLESQLESILPDLMLEFATKTSMSSFRLFEGREQFLAVLEESLRDATDEILYFGDLQNFVSYEGIEYEKSWIARRIKKKIRIRLTVQKPRDKQITELDRDSETELRKTRYLSDKFNLKSSFLIYGFKTLIWNTLAERAIVIDDPVITEMFKQIYEAMWESSEEK